MKELKKHDHERIEIKVHERIKKAKSNRSWKKLKFYPLDFVRAFRDCKKRILLRFSPDFISHFLSNGLE